MFLFEFLVFIIPPLAFKIYYDYWVGRDNEKVK